MNDAAVFTPTSSQGNVGAEVETAVTHTRLLLGIERWFLVFLPIAVLVGSYLAICLKMKSWWPWHTVVHEDGRRTLLQTVLYFDHAARELPLDLLLGSAVAGSMLLFYRPSTRMLPAVSSAFLAAMLTLLVAIIAVIVIGASMTVGNADMIDNLMQYHTRPGATLVWGAHWRYHVLERLALIFLSVALVGIHRVLSGLEPVNAVRPGLLFIGVTLATYVVASLIFGMTLEPFVDPQFLGHQARELVTHGSVTLPLSLAVCFLLSRRARTKGTQWGQRNHRWPIYLSGGCGVLLGGFVGLGAVMNKAHNLGQSSSMTILICSHYFEHAFTYIVTPLTAAALYSGALYWRSPNGHRSR